MAKFTISKSKVVEQYNSLKEKCDLISYSSKTNQVVAKILEEPRLEIGKEIEPVPQVLAY